MSGGVGSDAIDAQRSRALAAAPTRLLASGVQQRVAITPHRLGDAGGGDLQKEEKKNYVQKLI